MFNVCTEMPTGVRSRGFDYQTVVEAQASAIIIRNRLDEIGLPQTDVLIREDDTELERIKSDAQPPSKVE